MQANPLVSDYTILGSYGELHQVVNAVSPGSVNEVQSLEVASASDGTFTLTFNGQTTAPIDHDASAATVQAALLALTNLDSGDVVATGGALGTNPVVLTFGTAWAGRNVPQITADGGSLVGSGASVEVETTTSGAAAGTTLWLANVTQVEARISIDRQEIRRSGTRKTGYKRGAISADGTITGFKVTSRYVAAIAGEMEDESNPPAPMVLDIVLDDPESLGVERLRLLDVKLWELPFGFNVGDVIEEAIPFTFEDIRVLEEITGQMTR